MKGMIRAVWQYRFFILSSIRGEFRARFARSKLGAVWMIIHPLAQAAIFTLILSGVLSAKMPGMVDNRWAYSIYLLSGILAWSLFAEVVTRCLGLFVTNADLLKKMAFPRICLPFIVSGSALVNNLLLFLAIAGIFAILGHTPSPQILWTPLLFLVNLSFALGLGIALGVFNVFVRDVEQVVVVLLQLLFWFTPIVYPVEAVPEYLRPWLDLNPLYWLAQAYQNVLLFGTPPPVPGMLSLCAASAGLMALAFLLVHRAGPEMADVL